MAFENLERTQLKIADELRRNIKGNMLPQSLLFSGPRGSGRLTAALDLAFCLTGDRRDVLRSESIVYFPYRELLPRVKAAIELFERQRTDRSRLFLIETLRLVNMQYNGELYSGSLPQGYDKLFQLAQNVDIFLTGLEDAKEITDKDIKELESLKIASNPKYLYFGKSGPSPVTIEQLRGVKEWMQSSSRDKVAIIEDIESATEGAKNSILKMLEEPEEHLTIILVSSESQRIMETILSRVRKFNFPALSKESVSSFIKNSFNINSDYYSFDTFFFSLANDSESVRAVEEAVDYCVSLLVTGSPFTLEKEDEINALLEKLSAYTYFRERVVEEVEKLLLEGKIPPYRARTLLDIMSRWRESVETYNMNDKSGLDYMIREARSVKQIT